MQAASGGPANATWISLVAPYRGTCFHVVHLCESVPINSVNFVLRR